MEYNTGCVVNQRLAEWYLHRAIRCIDKDLYEFLPADTSPASPLLVRLDDNLALQDNPLVSGNADYKPLDDALASRYKSILDSVGRIVPQIFIDKLREQGIEFLVGPKWSNDNDKLHLVGHLGATAMHRFKQLVDLHHKSISNRNHPQIPRQVVESEATSQWRILGEAIHNGTSLIASVFSGNYAIQAKPIEMEYVFNVSVFTEPFSENGFYANANVPLFHCSTDEEFTRETQRVLRLMQ
jgi:hypothetical protein